MRKGWSALESEPGHTGSAVKAELGHCGGQLGPVWGAELGQLLRVSEALGQVLNMQNRASFKV